MVAEAEVVVAGEVDDLATVVVADRGLLVVEEAKAEVGAAGVEFVGLGRWTGVVVCSEPGPGERLGQEAGGGDGPAARGDHGRKGWHNDYDDGAAAGSGADRAGDYDDDDSSLVGSAGNAATRCRDVLSAGRKCTG